MNDPKRNKPDAGKLPRKNIPSGSNAPDDPPDSISSPGKSPFGKDAQKPASKTTPPEDSSPEDFEFEINELVAELKAVLGNGASRWYYDEPSETLYIELESLSDISEEDIERKAGPVLDACDIDFEEIILLPFTQ